MVNRLTYVVRRVVPVLSAGFLCQASGCTIDTNSILAGLANTIANNLIQSYVFGLFNLSTF